MPSLWEVMSGGSPKTPNLGCWAARVDKSQPSCAEWLAGTSDEKPNHVCWWIAAASVRRFLTEWGFLPDSTRPYLDGWPVPVGRSALAAWATARAPLESAGDHLADAVHEWLRHYIAIKEWLCWRGSAFRFLNPAHPVLAVPTEWIHPFLSQLVAGDYTWLMLAARRQTPAGVTWVLGTGGPISTLVEVHQVVDHAREGVYGYTWDERLSEHLSARKGDKRAEVVTKWGQYRIPVTLTKSVGGDIPITKGPYNDRRDRLTFAPLGDLAAQSRMMAEWMADAPPFTGIGRPKGSKEYWANREDFVRAVSAAIRAVQGKNIPVTRERVFEYLCGRMTNVPRPHGSGNYSLRQFDRDRKDYGFASWLELRDFCTTLD